MFPRSYTSSFSTGYSIAESVYYAPRDYLDFAELEFENIRDSNEPMLFPLPKLLLLIAKDEKSRKGTLRKVKPYLESIRDYEYIKRTMISDLGVKQTERITLRTKKQEEDDEYECETCSANLYVSFVSFNNNLFYHLYLLILTDILLRYTKIIYCLYYSFATSKKMCISAQNMHYNISKNVKCYKDGIANYITPTARRK